MNFLWSHRWGKGKGRDACREPWSRQVSGEKWTQTLPLSQVAKRGTSADKPCQRGEITGDEHLPPAKGERSM